MVTLVYNKGLEHIANGNIDFSVDTFKVMLVTSSYSPNKDTHDFRDDVTNEVSGTGYTAGGVALVPVVTVDTVNDRVEVDFPDTTFTAVSGFTAAAGVIYKSRGGLSSADEIIAYLDFGGGIAVSGGDLVINFTSPLRFQN